MPSEMAASYEDAKRKEKKYYYLKLTTSFFKDKAIKKLRKLPGGDTYALITLEIFLEALENDSRLYYDGIEDTFAKELALTINESPEAVQVAIDFLLSCGWLVEEDSETYYTPKGAEMSGSITASGLRKQRQKEREKQLNAGKIPQEYRISTASVPQNSDGVPKYRDIDRDKDKERDKEIEKMQEGKELSELCPSAFIEGNPRVNPTLSDIQSFASIVGFYAVSPEEFFNRFSSSEWMDGEKEITDWKALYTTLEGLARKGLAD